MRKYLLAAVAAAAIASPAAARDNSGYVGIEGGVMMPRDMNLDATVVYGGNLGTISYNKGISVDYKMGYDVDLIGGYDFGMFRLEGELGYKHAKIDSVALDSSLLGNLSTATGQVTPLSNTNYQAESGHISVLSGMVNALLDFGDDNWGGYAGGGIGYASAHQFGDSDSSWVWQAIAGVRMAISPNIDAGLKYRYFSTGQNLHFNDAFVVGAA